MAERILFTAQRIFRDEVRIEERRWYIPQYNDYRWRGLGDGPARPPVQTTPTEHRSQVRISVLDDVDGTKLQSVAHDLLILSRQLSAEARKRALRPETPEDEQALIEILGI